MPRAGDAGEGVTAVALAAIVLAAGLCSALVWAVYKLVRAVDTDADARVAQVATEAELERERYEHEVTMKALESARNRAQVLEEELAHDLADPYPTSPALDAADVRGRVLRIARRWADQESATRVVAATDRKVPADAAAAAAKVDGAGGG